MIVSLAANRAVAQEVAETAPGQGDRAAAPISEEQIEGLWEAENFERLEEIAADLRATKARFWNGAQQLPAFYTILAAFGAADPETSEGRVREWRAQNPASITALVASGEIYRELGNSERPDADEYAKRAHKILQEARERARASEGTYPDLYPALLYTAAEEHYLPDYTFEENATIVASAWRKVTVRDNALQRIFLEGQAVDPDYDYLYRARAITLLPSWNGIPGEVEAFAESVAVGHPDKYAHIAREVLEYVELDTYLAEHHFAWPHIDRGCALILERFPNATEWVSWYARLASAHGARGAAAAQFEALGDHWEDVWPDEPSFLRWRAWARGEKAYPFHRQLNAALANDDHATVRLILATGLDPNFTIETGWTLLALAGWWEDATLVEALLAEGADVAYGGESGNTALHGAAWGGDVAIVRRILTMKPPLNGQNADGETPLHQAVWSEEPAVVEMVLGAGGDIGIVDDDGFTALHVSAFLGTTAIAETLLDAGSDPNLAENDGRTALHLAATGGEVALVELLLQRGADPLLADVDGETALDAARIAGHDEIVAMLEEVTAQRNETAE